jgi:hypothetical protein
VFYREYGQLINSQYDLDAAWQHIMRVFSDAGADNVTWQLVMNNRNGTHAKPQFHFCCMQASKRCTLHCACTSDRTVAVAGACLTCHSTCLTFHSTYTTTCYVSYTGGYGNLDVPFDEVMPFPSTLAKVSNTVYATTHIV